MASRKRAACPPASVPAFEKFKRQDVSHCSSEPAAAKRPSVADDVSAVPAPVRFVRSLAPDEEREWLSTTLCEAELTAALEGADACPKAVVACLRAIAQNLLCRVALVIDGKPHRLEELEAYVRTRDGAHADPFTHADERQYTFGKAYFHRVGSGYKGGTYKVCAPVHANVRKFCRQRSLECRAWTSRLDGPAVSPQASLCEQSL